MASYDEILLLEQKQQDTLDALKKTRELFRSTSYRCRRATGDISTYSRQVDLLKKALSGMRAAPIVLIEEWGKVHRDIVELQELLDDARTLFNNSTAENRKASELAVELEKQLAQVRKDLAGYMLVIPFRGKK